MNVVYRIVAAALAVGSGIVIAGIIVALTGTGDVNVLWALVFGAVALLAGAAALLLWSRAAGR